MTRRTERSQEREAAAPEARHRLEIRYRRLLRLLPAWYRAEREQEMVEVFLDDRAARVRDTGELDAEYGWPGWGEAAAITGLAVRTRVGGPNDPPGPHAVGDVVRAAATGAVVLNAATAAVGVVWTVVAALVGPTAAVVHLEGLLRPHGFDAWWSAVAFALALCWLPAWTALAAGRGRTALLLALAATAPGLVSLATSLVEDPLPLATMVVAMVALDVLALALLALGFHRDAPPPSVARPWWLLAATLLAMLAAAPLDLVVQSMVQPQAIVLLVAVVLAVVAGRRGAAVGGLAVLAATVAVAGLLQLAVVENGQAGPALTAGVALAAVLVAVPAARRDETATPG